MNIQNEKFVIYLVEDDEAVLNSLCAFLKSHRFETIRCATAEHFLDIFDPQKKACLILDLRLPGMSGTQLQARLREMHISLPIIILTAHGDVPVAVEAMRAGAIDFIEKPADADRLLEAVTTSRGILQNQQPAAVPKNIVDDRLSKLTDREREVLDHLLQGKLNKEIAGELNLSPRTVEVHRSRIREKMRARGIADLIRMLG